MFMHAPVKRRSATRLHYTIRPRGLIPARLQSPDAENRTSGGVGALAGATSRQGDPIRLPIGQHKYGEKIA